MRRLASAALNGLLAVVAPLVLFAWVEGCSSAAIALRGALDANEGPSLRQHDPLLGWVSVPSLSLSDVWGPGRHLHTNARGFRGKAAVADSPAPGRLRVVCSGDSFAFGEGVGDEHTWCHHLSLLDDRLEALNLGQAGYGIDQAYLRFREEGAPLAAHLHVFSFIGPDLTRAGNPSFQGFAKPLFVVEEGSLALTGVPVPERGPALRRFATGVVDRLSVSEFVRRGVKKLFGKRRNEGDAIFERLGPMLDGIFAAAAETTRAAGAEIVFVYLPLASEIEEDGRWRGWVRESFARSGLPFVDLTESLRAQVPEEARVLFIREGAPAAGHYSERGNAWAARALYAELRPRLDRLGRGTEAFK